MLRQLGHPTNFMHLRQYKPVGGMNLKCQHVCQIDCTMLVALRLLQENYTKNMTYDEIHLA
jgi:hypothetical protein